MTEPLRAALRAHRVNHAYLFSGPRGCGKTTSARILARCLNCAEGPTDTPCGQCESCRELATGGPGSLDVVEIDAASHGGVDDARDLRERATFAPVRDRYKVFIIDEAHMVSPQGFNALLKLVEEPPEHVKFIFATTEPERVIGTIRSRTHHYPFRLVPPDILEPYLHTLCDEENIRVGEGVLPLVIRAGGGSVRDSLSVLDQLMAGAIEGEIAYKTAVALLGYTDTALLDESVDALAGGDGSAAYRVIEKMVSSGHDPRRFVEDFLQRLRDLLIIAVAGDGASDVLVGTPHDQFERMSIQAKNWGTQALSRAADLTDQALRSMTGATSPRLQLELLIGRILVPAPSAHSDAGYVASAQGQSGGGSGPLSGGVGLVGGGAPAEKPAGAGSFGARQAREALARKKAEKSGEQGAPQDQPQTQIQPQSVPEARAESPVSSGGWDVAQPAQRGGDGPAPQAAQRQAEQHAPLPQQRSPKHDSNQPEAPAPATTPTPATTPAPAPSRPAGGAAGADLIRQRWGDVVERLATHSRVVWSLLSQNGQLGAVDGDQLVLLFPSQGMVASFTNGGKAQIVEETIYDVLGIRLNVSAQVGQAGGGPAVSTPSANAHAVATPPVQGTDPQSPASYDWRTQEPPPFDPGEDTDEDGDAELEAPAASQHVSQPTSQPAALQDSALDQPEDDEDESESFEPTVGWSEAVIQPPSFDPEEEESAPSVPAFAEVTPLPSQRFAALDAREETDESDAEEASPETENESFEAPTVSAAEDDSASIDDEDMSESNLFGIPAVLDILGGTIIEQKADDQGGW